ncbi:MAG: indolepyruvate oxidoreductase subunit beta [Flavobacteriaceae bacterium]|nr:indolepyruvate oxidoreductase subunit beta [Flavobacteriaceae bacterium]
MTTNIILAGVGGQGILTVAGILDLACLNNGLFFKQSEVHGMSQRGGVVYSHVRISDDVIYSDIIPLGQADIILATEPMELLRYLPFLKKDGWLLTDSETFENIANYPQKERILDSIKTFPNHMIVEATEIAQKIGNAKASNLVMLGVVSNHIPIKERALRAAIKSLFDKKGDRVLELNLKAFDAGREYAMELV